MRRHWLFFAMAMAPCLALGAWAVGEYAARSRTDEATLRHGWRELARESAGALLAQRLDAVRTALAAYPRPADAARIDAWHEAMRRSPSVAATVVFAADGAVAKALPPRPPAPTTALDGRLVEARRLEFVVHDPAAAERAYRPYATGPDASGEAQAGLITALIAQQRADEAMAALRDADRLGPSESATLALEVCALPTDARGLAATLLAVWRRTLPDSDAACVRLGAALTDRIDALDAAAAAEHARLRALLARDRAAEALAASLPSATRAWLADAARHAGDVAPSGLADGGAVMAAPMADGGVAVAVIAVDELRVALADGLARHAALAALAAAYRARHGGSIADGEPLRLPTPWGGELAVPLPTGEPSPALGRLSAETAAIAFLASAVAIAGLGFVLLARTTAREIRLARLKSDFVSNVSHEMRTPLSLLRMFGEMLTLGYARSDEEHRRYAGVIVREASRLSQLVGNVLDLAAIEDGHKRFAFAPVDLAALTTQVVESYRPQLDADGFALSVDVAASDPVILGDADALTQVLVNLLGNAAKYSRHERSIAVAVATRGAEAVLSVADRGIGIAPADHERIFQRFHRVETGLTRETRGAGLGLSLVASIVAAHGGRVRVDSDLGRGSTFSVVLPLADAASEATA